MTPPQSLDPIATQLVLRRLTALSPSILAVSLAPALARPFALSLTQAVVAVTLRALARPAVAATAIMIIRAIVAATTRALVHAVAATAIMAIMIIRAIVAATTSRSRSHAVTATRNYDYSRYRRRARLALSFTTPSPRRLARSFTTPLCGSQKTSKRRRREGEGATPSRAAATGFQDHARARLGGAQGEALARSRHQPPATGHHHTTRTSAALEERIAPSLPRQAKRARSVVGEQDDRDGAKRQRQEASPETAPQENNRVLMKLRFAIRKPGDGGRPLTSMTFFATHLIATDQTYKGGFLHRRIQPG
ncbi:hypothetical protein C8F04DRAFT_1264187 [Mycena alexandri]|uniref:Uncharacterized protein n=1 Tax=Mycena alexandri TaxID=1745969 RepID=A0AAD6WYK6_9AGAR|nr:hypothetical protein C8F04DRAFT_1264187 [Mycena alexandri]